MKLYINEDTACVPAKTSYVDSGLDANGIYYFGKKPDPPQNWKDYLKKGRRTKMVKRDKLSEGYDEMAEQYLAEDTDIEEYGRLLPMDEVVYGMVNNIPEDEIDEAVKYFNVVSGLLGARGMYNKVYCYLCEEDWLDPMNFDYIRRDTSKVYKNGKYDSYKGSFQGHKFVVDKFSNNYAFTIYAKDEQTIIDIMTSVKEEYE